MVSDRCLEKQEHREVVASFGGAKMKEETWKKISKSFKLAVQPSNFVFNTNKFLIREENSSRRSSGFSSINNSSRNANQTPKLKVSNYQINR